MDDVTAVSGDGGTRRVAYLTNVYPKPSHSFIRTEIEALERLGFEVMRFSIRRHDGPLPDARDRAEAARTTCLLNGAAGRLLRAGAAAFARSPWRAARALALAIAANARGAGPVAAAGYFLEACALAAAMRRAGVHHVHVHFGTNPAAVARIAARLAGIGYSVTVHGPDEFDAPVALDLRGKIRDARFAVAISDHGRAQLMRWADAADRGRLHVVRCGLDATFLSGAAPPPPPPAGAPRLVCVARLSAQKGLDVLIEAMREVAAHGPATVTVIGGGEMEGEIAAAIAAHGLDGCVLLAGWQDADAIRRAILAAHALVLPSFAEGLPVVLMEALALGRPVITTGVAGIPELVDGGCGWLVPPARADALATAIRDALAQPPERLHAMGLAGRARVARLHDAARNAALLADLLRRHARVMHSQSRSAGDASPSQACDTA